MLLRLGALIIKELTQFTRDRILMTISIVMPLLQIILLGNAISADIQNIRIAIIDYDRTSLSREIATVLDNTNELVVAYYPDSLEEARNLIDTHQISGMVVIPNGFMADSLSPTATPQVQVILDGSHSYVAARALAAASGAIQDLVEDAIIAQTGRPLGGIRVFTEALYNRTLDFQPDAVVSQMGLIVFQITSLIAVMGIVRERDIGTLEMLTITPLRREEIVAGKAITPGILGMLNFFIMYSVVTLVFGVPMRGSFPMLLIATLLYLGSEIGFSLIISALMRTQQQAITAMFIWINVALTLSGYLVPISTLPKALQWISYVLPLRHYLVVMRSIVLKGSTLANMQGDVIALGVLMVISLGIAARLINRAID